MPAPINGYNIGSDTTLVIVSNGQVLAAQILTSFHPRQVAPRMKSVGIDGVNRYRDIEEGWEGDLRYDRADSSLDAYFAAKEAGRYAGQQPPVVYIQETTTNVDGSVSMFQYTGVTMALADAGNRTGDAKVEQHVSWAASRRIQIQ